MTTPGPGETRGPFFGLLVGSRVVCSRAPRPVCRARGGQRHRRQPRGREEATVRRRRDLPWRRRLARAVSAYHWTPQARHTAAFTATAVRRVRRRYLGYGTLRTPAWRVLRGTWR